MVHFSAPTDSGYTNTAAKYTDFIKANSSKAVVYFNPAVNLTKDTADLHGAQGLKDALAYCEGMGNGCTGIWLNPGEAKKAGVDLPTDADTANALWGQYITDTTKKMWGVKQSLEALDHKKCPPWVTDSGAKCTLGTAASNYTDGQSPPYFYFSKNKPTIAGSGEQDPPKNYLNTADLYSDFIKANSSKAVVYFNPAVNLTGTSTGTGAQSLSKAITDCEAMGNGCTGIWLNPGEAKKAGVDLPTDSVTANALWTKYITDTTKAMWGVKESIEALDHNHCPPWVTDSGAKCTLGTAASNYSDGQTPPYFYFSKVGQAIQGHGLWCLASITKIPKVVNGNIEHVEIKDLKVGDIIQTTRGNMPISDIMNTDTRGYVHDNYVKVEKGALGENFPSEDLYVTHEHSFSLGYYKNSLLNRNIHDNEQDNMVYLHITADQLADKLPGVTRVSKEFESAINLVFDEHTSINIYGLDVVTHHPKGNPLTLPEEKYQDKSKFNSKVQKPLFASYDMLVNAKPEHMEMKDFLRGCITADLNNKLNLKNVNNISFTPQKTMLTDDLRQKLKVV